MMRISEYEGQRVKIALNVLILVFSLHSVFKKDYRIEGISVFDKFVIDTFGVVQGGVSSALKQVGSVFEHYFFNVDASRENIGLKKKIANLENQLFSYEELIKENKRLKSLLEVEVSSSFKKVSAQIVGWDASSDFNVIRINRGLKDGLSLQSIVMTDKGLIGYVYRLTNHYADVLTILDSNNRVDGLISRTRSHGILEGDSNRQCILKYVSTNEPVILGDVVVTSGLGNLYPKGILIGTVSRIERESYSVTQNIKIKPAVNFSTLEEVIVLVANESGQKKKEWEALDAPERGRK